MNLIIEVFAELLHVVVVLFYVVVYLTLSATEHLIHWAPQSLRSRRSGSCVHRLEVRIYKLRGLVTVFETLLLLKLLVLESLGWSDLIRIVILIVDYFYLLLLLENSIVTFSKVSFNWRIYLILSVWSVSVSHLNNLEWIWSSLLMTALCKVHILLKNNIAVLLLVWLEILTLH